MWTKGMFGLCTCVDYLFPMMPRDFTHNTRLMSGIIVMENR